MNANVIKLSDNTVNIDGVVYERKEIDPEENWGKEGYVDPAGHFRISPGYNEGWPCVKCGLLYSKRKYFKTPDAHYLGGATWACEGCGTKNEVDIIIKEIQND